MRTAILKKIFRRLNEQRGALYLELALIVPVLTLLFFGSVEFGKVMQANQKASFLSREAGNAVFRACAGKVPPDFSTACIQTGAVNHFSSFVNMGATPAEVDFILQIFQWNPVTMSVDRVAVLNTANPPTQYTTTFFPGLPTVPPSQFAAQITAFEPLNPTKKSIFVTSEVFLQYKPKISNVFQYVPPILISEATIF